MPAITRDGLVFPHVRRSTFGKIKRSGFGHAAYARLSSSARANTSLGAWVERTLRSAAYRPGAVPAAGSDSRTTAPLLPEIRPVVADGARPIIASCRLMSSRAAQAEFASGRQSRWTRLPRQTMSVTLRPNGRPCAAGEYLVFKFVSRSTLADRGLCV